MPRSLYVYIYYLIKSKDLSAQNFVWHVFVAQQKSGKGFSRSFTDSETGKKVVSAERTSSYFHLRKFGDPKITAIETRAAELVGVPPENVEPLQVRLNCAL